MANILLEMGDVSVFPSVQRNIETSRLFTETNTISIVNRLLDIDGFVIDINTYDGLAQFNILGHYFRCNLENFPWLDFGTSGTLFAKVGVTKNEINGQYELTGVDNEDQEYTGVEFTNDPPGTVETRGVYFVSSGSTLSCYLPLLEYEKVDNAYVLSPLVDRLPKVNWAESAHNIDCGTIG